MPSRIAKIAAARAPSSRSLEADVIDAHLRRDRVLEAADRQDQERVRLRDVAPELVEVDLHALVLLREAHEPRLAAERPEGDDRPLGAGDPGRAAMELREAEL